MAQSQAKITAAQGAFTELTSGDADKITFQVISGRAFIHLTDDGTSADPRPRKAGGITAGQGELDIALAKLKSSGTPKRVWARSAHSQDAQIVVDHVDAV